MILIVVFIPDSVFALKICLLLFLQIGCIFHAVFVRSFATIKDQTVEILSEIIFVILIALLVNCNSEEKWTDTSTYIFIGIIMGHLLALLIVSIVSAIVEFKEFLKRYKNKSQKLNFEEDQDNGMSAEKNNEVEDSCSIHEKLETQGTIFPRNIDTFILRTQNNHDLITAEEGKHSNGIINRTIW